MISIDANKKQTSQTPGLIEQVSMSIGILFFGVQGFPAGVTKPIKSRKDRAKGRPGVIKRAMTS